MRLRSPLYLRDSMPRHLRRALSLLTAAGVTVALPTGTLGATWREPVPLVTDAPATPTGLVTLGASTAVVAFYTYAKELGGPNGIWVNTSVDAGATWGSPVSVAQGDGVCCAAIAGFGRRVDVIWANSSPSNLDATQLYYKRSVDRGRSFGPRTTVVQTGWAAISRFSVARGPNGLVAVQWEELEECVNSRCDDRITYRVRASSDGGSSFGETHTLATALGDRSSMGSSLATGDGVIYVVYMRSERELCLKRSLDGGATWSSPVTISVAARFDSFDRALALTATGSQAAVAYVEWQSPRVRALLLKHSANGGRTWSSPATLSNVERRQIFEPHLTWQGGTVRAAFGRCPFTCHHPAGLKMFYRASADGVTWTPTQKVADYVVPTAIGFAGQVLILYDSWHNNMGPVVVAGSAH